MMTSSRSFTVHPGDSITAYGIRVHILKMWDEPNSRNNATDFTADTIAFGPRSRRAANG